MGGEGGKKQPKIHQLPDLATLLQVLDLGTHLEQQRVKQVQGGKVSEQPKILKHPKVSLVTQYSTPIPPAAGPGLRLHSQTAHGSCSQASSKVASTRAFVCSPIPARQTRIRQVS